MYVGVFVAVAALFNERHAVDEQVNRRR